MSKTPPRSVSMDDPLPERMAVAALWLEEASDRYYADRVPDEEKRGPALENIEWSPANLRHVAAQFREDDRVRDALRDDIAQVICDAHLAPPHRTAELIMMRFDVRARSYHPTGLGKVKKTDG